MKFQKFAAIAAFAVLSFSTGTSFASPQATPTPWTRLTPLPGDPTPRPIDCYDYNGYTQGYQEEVRFFENDIVRWQGTYDKLAIKLAGYQSKLQSTIDATNSKIATLDRDLAAAKEACPVYDGKNSVCRKISRLERNRQAGLTKIEKARKQTELKVSRLQPRVDQSNTNLELQKSRLAESKRNANYYWNLTKSCSLTPTGTPYPL